MCDTCACATPAEISSRHRLLRSPPPSLAARARTKARITRDDYDWNFAMDWYVVPPAPADPDAPETPADIAFDCLVARVQTRLTRVRAGLLR